MGSCSIPSTDVGAGIPATSRIMGATSITWANWERSPPASVMRSGQCTTRGLRVPPRCEADLLAPLERRVPGPCPGRSVVRRHDRGAPRVDPAIALGELELHLVGERDAVLHRQLVERAGERSFHAGAVVAPDPDDQRVVQLAQLVDRVDHPPDVVVGVLRVAGVDLHLAGVERLQFFGHVLPRRERLIARGQLRVGGDDAELLLPGEGLLAQPVPALVELALVPVRPLLRDMMRGVTAAGREVDEERLTGILAADAVQPLDGLVRHGVGEVVRVLLVVELGGRTDDLLVLGQARVILARPATEDPVEVVEPPPVRPPVERSGRALLPVRRQMPLAERGRAVPVVPQDPRQRRAVTRQDGRVAGETTGELADRAEPDGVVVPPGQQRRAGGRAQRRDVHSVVAQPTRAIRVKFGVRIGPPKVLGFQTRHRRSAQAGRSAPPQEGRAAR